MLSRSRRPCRAGLSWWSHDGTVLVTLPVFLNSLAPLVISQGRFLNRPRPLLRAPGLPVCRSVRRVHPTTRNTRPDRVRVHGAIYWRTQNRRRRKRRGVHGRRIEAVAQKSRSRNDAHGSY